MAATREKYKRVEQLYTVGKVALFKGDVPVWVQVMNPLQLDEARTDATTAKARMSLALKEIGSDEQTKALAVFRELSTEQAIEAVISFKWNEWFNKANTRMRDNSDWTERVLVMDRTDDDEMTRRGAEDPEKQLYEQITRDFIGAVQEEIDLERGYERSRLQQVSPSDLQDDYLNLYQSRRAEIAANLEYAACEAWYSARVCAGVLGSDAAEPNLWDHSKCEGHLEQVWESKADYKAAPAEMQEVIRTAISELGMTVREAKNSDSTTSSSASSVLQNVPEESTPSTPIETLSLVPGLSM